MSRTEQYLTEYESKAVVQLRTDVTIEQVFAAVVERAGSLTPTGDGPAIDAFLAVAHFLMIEGRTSLGAGKYRLKTVKPGTKATK